MSHMISDVKYDKLQEYALHFPDECHVHVIDTSCQQ